MNGPQDWSRTGNDTDTERSSTDQAEGEIRNNVVPSQWWFATTSFPLLAGTFGPMASAFNVCALTHGWRESSSSDETKNDGLDMSNPAWIVVTNAVSLALAVTANLTLFSKFCRGPSFLVGHSVVIVAWYTSFLLLITTIAVAFTQLQLRSSQDNFFSQAFYYACFAAGLYFVVSSLMLISVHGARSGYYSKEAKQIRNEHALAYQTTSSMIYLLGGAAVFSRIEKWNYLDAVYWADCTILTIGLGDYAPKTHFGRSMVFPFAVGGVLLLGLVIASIQSLMTQRQERKRGSMMKEKQHNLLRRLQSSRPRREIDREDFKMLRDIQDRFDQKQQWILLLASGTAWFVLWLLSAVIFRRTERDQDWSYFQALYFTFTSLMTIGYGDFYPTSNAGKPLFVFWSLLAVPTITILVSSLGNTIIRKLKDHSLRLGKFAPHVEESSRMQSLICFLGKATKIKAFDTEHSIDSPQGFSAKLRSSSWKKGKMRDESIKPVAETQNRAIQCSSRDIMETGPSLAKDQPYYHYLLIKEIHNIKVHLLASPTREYTYDEWAWFLTLVSGDEYHGNSRANVADKAKWVRSQDFSEPGGGEDDGSRLSNRLENRSYLGSNKSEGQWMLDNLIATLMRELKSKLEEHWR